MNAVALAQVGQLPLQHQGEERAEHETTDRRLAGVEDRASAKHRFGAASWSCNAESAKRARDRREKLSAIELHWLLADNAAHFEGKADTDG